MGWQHKLHWPAANIYIQTTEHVEAGKYQFLWNEACIINRIQLLGVERWFRHTDKYYVYRFFPPEVILKQCFDVNLRSFSIKILKVMILYWPFKTTRRSLLMILLILLLSRVNDAFAMTEVTTWVLICETFVSGAVQTWCKRHSTNWCNNFSRETLTKFYMTQKHLFWHPLWSLCPDHISLVLAKFSSEWTTDRGQNNQSCMCMVETIRVKTLKQRKAYDQIQWYSCNMWNTIEDV